MRVTRPVIAITVVVSLPLALALWYGGSRWYLLQEIYSVPGAAQRLAAIPEELDLTKVRAPAGTLCIIGYAEFIVPRSPSVRLACSKDGLGVIGNSETLSFALLPPLNPRDRDQEFNTFLSQLTQVPKKNPLRESLERPDATGVDFLIQIEKTRPEPFLRTVFWDHSSFAVYSTLLTLKATTNIGRAYTFTTPDAHGLIYAGNAQGDMSIGQVSILSPSRNMGVGIRVRLADSPKGDVMSDLPALLKTFKFTVDRMASKEETRKWIAAAIISPQPKPQKVNETHAADK